MEGLEIIKRARAISLVSFVLNFVALFFWKYSILSDSPMLLSKSNEMVEFHSGVSIASALAFILLTLLSW